MLISYMKAYDSYMVMGTRVFECYATVFACKNIACDGTQPAIFKISALAMGSRVAVQLMKLRHTCFALLDEITKPNLGLVESQIRWLMVLRNNVVQAIDIMLMDIVEAHRMFWVAAQESAPKDSPLDLDKVLEKAKEGMDTIPADALMHAVLTKDAIINIQSKRSLFDCNLVWSLDKRLQHLIEEDLKDHLVISVNATRSDYDQAQLEIEMDEHAKKTAAKNKPAEEPPAPPPFGVSTL